MNEKIYPKVTVDLSSLSTRVADIAIFRAMNTGMYENMHAVENTSHDARCIGEKALGECEASKNALIKTLTLFGQDDNEGLTGHVGYEKANTTCTTCDSGCSVRVQVEDGKPTEKIRFLYYESTEKLVREGKMSVLRLSGFDNPTI